MARNLSWGEDMARAARAAADFVEESRACARPTLVQPPLADILHDLQAEDLVHKGGLTGDRLDEFLETYLSATTRIHDPRYMAHQTGSPNEGGAVAMLLDGALANPMNIYEMGPAAAALEHLVIDWMLKKIGWPPASGSSAGAGGVLTHGGSLANLTALAAARARIAPDAWERGTPDDLVILAPAECHYSVARAAGLLGLGAANARPLPADAQQRIDPDGLPAFFRALQNDGKRVMALVANAAATAAGLYDPLSEIADFCEEQGLWLHVDGAHGASALVSDRLRGLMRGVERADSLIWDAHKMLRTPPVCAAVLTRDHRDLDRALSAPGSYIAHEKDEPGVDFIHRTVECTKAALGLRAFMTIARDGEAAIADYVESRTELAQAAADYIGALPDFEVAATPETNIVCFRIDGADDRQLEIRKALLKQGDFFFSSTEYLGRRWLRLALMNPATTLDDVKALIDAIRAAAKALG